MNQILNAIRSAFKAQEKGKSPENKPFSGLSKNGPSESTNPGPYAVSRAQNVKKAQTNVQTVQDKGLCLVTLTGVI